MNDSRRHYYYTDGSANPASRLGGWGVVRVVCEGHSTVLTLQGRATDTTNNRMELTAIIRACQVAVDMGETEITVYSDSQLSINCAQGLWKRNVNLDLWKVYDDVAKKVKVNLIKVKAHNGDTYNEMADRLADYTSVLSPKCSACGDLEQLTYMRGKDVIERCDSFEGEEDAPDERSIYLVCLRCKCAM